MNVQAVTVNCTILCWCTDESHNKQSKKTEHEQVSTATQGALCLSQVLVLLAAVAN